MGWEEDRKASSPPPRISYRKEGEKRGGREKEEATILLGEGARGCPCVSLLPYARVFTVLIICLWSVPGAGCPRSGAVRGDPAALSMHREGESSRALPHPSPMKMLPRGGAAQECRPPTFRQRALPTPIPPSALIYLGFAWMACLMVCVTGKGGVSRVGWSLPILSWDESVNGDGPHPLIKEPPPSPALCFSGSLAASQPPSVLHSSLKKE